MRSVPFTCLALLAFMPLARADVWADPDMAEAVAGAELIVLARAPAGGSHERPVVRFAVERTLAGKAPAELEVSGLHDPTMSAGPVFAPGERVYLLLRRHQGRWQVPTPTFGRYPLREGAVHYATLRDTYLRLTLAPADFEAYVALLLGRPDERWLAALRADLRESSPVGVEPATRARQYLALEALARVGGAADLPAIEACLTPEAPFQLRVSACRALARAAGPAAGERLLTLAREDPEPAVRTAAARALGALSPPPRRLVARLASLLARADPEPVRFSGPNDPRTNRWPSPQVALLEAITRLGAAPAKGELLALLDAPSTPLEPFSAALRALLTLKGDRDLPRELARRLGREGVTGGDLYDRELCAALTQLTGERFGLDVARWKAWAERR